MKIGLQTWGSNGDIRPMIALADGLQKAGHQVTLVVASVDNRSYADTCAELGIAYRQVPPHIDFDLQEFAQRTFEMNTLEWLLALLDASFFPFEHELYAASQQLANENEVLIGHHFLYPLKLAAKKQDKPHISITYCHAAIPAKSHPPFKFPDLGRWLNQLQWHLLDWTFDWGLKKRLSQLWLAEGMPPFKHVFSSLINSDILNIVAAEPFLCPYHHEWEPLNQVTGFFNLPDYAEPWQPSEALQAFLASGSKPVYMTFGSLQQSVPEWSMEMFIEASQRAECRAIIVSSSPKYPVDTHQGEVFFIGRHPHAPVFQQCAAVVHHGGAGTSQTATLNGCPSIVIPFMDEQLFWAEQLHRANLAAKPLPAQKANAILLAERIRSVLNTPEQAAKAQQVAKDFVPERGVTQAVALIEQAVQKFQNDRVNA